MEKIKQLIAQEELKLKESKGKEVSENMHQYALAVLRKLLKECQEN